MKAGFEQQGDMVQIRMTQDDWHASLILFGIAMGTLGSNGSGRMLRDAMRLTNRLNRGNPKFTMYQVPEEPPQAG